MPAKHIRKIIRRFVRTHSREYFAYLLARLRAPRPNQHKVVIFAQGRTGSALLESLLASTGYLPANAELLNTHSGEIRWPKKYLDGLTRWRRFLRSGNFMFHVKHYQLTEDRRHPVDVRAFLEALVADGWKIIYLKRDNVVKQAISSVFATSSGRFHRFGTQPDADALRMDCDELIRQVEWRINNSDIEKKLLNGLDHHSVVYERDLEPASWHQQTVDAVLDYLELPRARAQTSHRKVVGRDLSASILNYDEVRAQLQRHGLAQYLEA